MKKPLYTLLCAVTTVGTAIVLRTVTYGDWLGIVFVSFLCAGAISWLCLAIKEVIKP